MERIWWSLKFGTGVRILYFDRWVFNLGGSLQDKEYLFTNDCLQIKVQGLEKR